MTDSNQQMNGSEEKPVVNIGAVVGSPDFDRQLVSVASKLGTVKFRFLCYYIGGQRAKWTPVAGQTPPDISVPDMQMEADTWSRYFCGQTSPWIDVDAEDDSLAAVSERALQQELDYAKYLNLKAVMITLKHRDSPRLAALLAKRMWTTNVYYRIWIVVPTEATALGGQLDGDERDLWGVWADFRRSVANHRLLGACVKLSADLDDEFVEPRRYRRWLAEPVAAIWLDADLFMQDANNKPSLPRAHSALVRALFAPTPSAQSIISSSSAAAFDPHILGLYVPAVAQLFAEREGVDSDDPTSSIIHGFDDALQVPLQPLSDNLDSHTYEIFEKDPTKYVQYQRAIELAADKLVNDGVIGNNELVVMVLGAGRGPLVSAAIKAESALRRRRGNDVISFRLFAVEKNENAIVTLKFMNDTYWRQRVQVVCSDMRSFRPDLQADIVVSELLGSFGDNELSPECLDGAQHIMKPTTINIPLSYTSHLAPVQSFKMRGTIWEFSPSAWMAVSKRRADPIRLPDGVYRHDESPHGNMDQPYVVRLHSYYAPASPQPVFTFTHPNSTGASNERHDQVTFRVGEDCEVMGFAGYFDTVLFGDVTLSIVPETHSPGLISWFPALFPLRDMVRLKKDTELSVEIWRRVDDGGVWYEWRVHYESPDGPVTTELQNPDGQSYYMRLQ